MLYSLHHSQFAKMEFMLMVCLSGCWFYPAHSKTDDVFQSGPGQITVHLGDEVSLVWILAQSVDVTAEFAYMEIYNNNNNILRATSSGCDNKGDNRLSCITQGTSVGFSIRGSGVQLTDAGPYRCYVKPPGIMGAESNEDALIYIYRAPTTPTITGNTLSVAGVNLTLLCSAASQSLPKSERPAAVIEYTWSTSLPHTSLSANTVTVGPLTRDHDGATVTCTANEQGSTLTSGSTVTITIIYPPGSAQLQANKATVVKGVDDLVMTCQVPAGEEGKPNTYTYEWRNPKQQVSGNGMSFTIYKNSLDADLHDGTWQCTPSNTAGSGTPGTKTITVLIASTIVKFESSHQGDLISSYCTTLTCEVESRPEAYIQLVHVDSGTELEKVNSGLRVQHTLINVSCLDGGTYSCDTSNSIGNPDSKNIALDVKCPPSAFSRVPEYIGKELNSTLSHSTPTLANPVIMHNDVYWTYESSNGPIKRKRLPDDVITSVVDTTHPLVKNLTIYISQIQESHFGTYTVTTTNQYGSIRMEVKIVPQGPPVAPSAPRLIKVTAVSLLIEWTAGFNGGFVQRFTVMYMQAGGMTDQSVQVLTAPGISSGDVVRFKLQETISAETMYQVKVISENDYEGSDKQIGPEAWFTTKAKPQFPENKNPTVEFQSDSIIIKLDIMNTDSLSHLVINICSDETQTLCGDPQNVADLSVGQVVVPLPPVSMKEYHIELVMYDGEDEVNKQTWIQEVPKELQTSAIVGGVLGALLLACVLIITVLLWRRGVLRKLCHQAEPRKNTPVVIYENVAHTGLQSDAGTDSRTPRGNANDIPVTRDSKRKNEVTGFTAGADTDNTEATYEELTDDYAPRQEPAVYEQMVPHNQRAVASEQLETDHQMRPYYENVV